VDLDAAVADYRRAVAGVDAARRAAERRIEAARERADTARLALAAAMVEAANGGVRPTDIERRTGYTRERVRQILRAGGVEAE
jgi:hypothetical protein